MRSKMLILLIVIFISLVFSPLDARQTAQDIEKHTEQGTLKMAEPESKVEEPKEIELTKDEALSLVVAHRDWMVASAQVTIREGELNVLTLRMYLQYRLHPDDYWLDLAHGRFLQRERPAVDKSHKEKLK